ncbi:recombinase family protein [Aeoliella sp.]|uniref:recombinase family protein n=1 Tax=Aeoliella sp. TaxID=2795800 RepID=UPI003CCBF68C
MPKRKQHIAIYTRVSSDQQKHDSQLADLKVWASQQSEPVVWYRDVVSGKTKPNERPGWAKLDLAMQQGKVSTIVVWRIDRLGRKLVSLSKLFADLIDRGIGLVSLKDGLDLTTPAGRLMAGVLASVAQFEREVSLERQRNGIKAARDANGGTCPWGGSEKGRRHKRIKKAERKVLELFEKGVPISGIARSEGLSRTTIYKLLAANREPVGGQ